MNFCTSVLFCLSLAGTEVLSGGGSGNPKVFNKKLQDHLPLTILSSSTHGAMQKFRCTRVWIQAPEDSWQLKEIFKEAQPGSSFKVGLTWPS